MTDYSRVRWEVEQKWEGRLWPGNNPYENVLFTFKCIIPNHIPIAELLATYGTERRRYHNVSHLWDMLSLGTGMPHLCSDVDPLFLAIAIAGHDVVYNYLSTPSENEVMSAVRTASFFELKPMMAHAIGHAIFATAKHAEDLSNWASTLAKELLDRDLYSFAKPYDEFKQDSENVIEEIFLAAGEACKPKSRDDIIRGQCAFYEQLLMSRATIYYRHTEWESQARQNLVLYVKEKRGV